MLRAFLTLTGVMRLHIVAIGAMGTLTFAWALCRTYAWGLALASAVDWFVVNWLNKAVDLVEDEKNGIPGTGFIARHRRAVLASGALLLLGSFAITAVVAPALLPFRAAFHALGAAYNWRLLPTRTGRRRIKELYFWKNSASATGFLLTLFAYPLSTLSMRDDVTRETVLTSMLFFFLFEISYEVLYDLRDVQGDTIAGVRTYPVVHGVAGGARICVGLMVASVLVVVAGFAAGVVPWRIAVMGAAPALQLAVVARALPSRVTSTLCIGITWLGAGLLATYHAWEWLGLPGSGR